MTIDMCFNSLITLALRVISSFIKKHTRNYDFFWRGGGGGGGGGVAIHKGVGTIFDIAFSIVSTIHV